MAQSFIENGESGASVRAKLNDRWQVLAQSSVAVTCPADTNDNILATITIPAGAMGPNGRLRVTSIWTVNNNSNTKTLKTRFGTISGTLYGSAAVTTQTYYRDQREVCNRNSESSQVGTSTGTTGGFGQSTTGVSTSTIDTSASTTLLLTGQKAVAGDTIVLESYVVELLHAD